MDSSAGAGFMLEGYDVPLVPPVNLAPGDAAAMELPERVIVDNVRIEQHRNMFVTRNGNFYHNLQMHRLSLPYQRFLENRRSHWSQMRTALKVMGHSRHVTGEVVMVTDAWSQNYYHWVCEALARLEVVAQREVQIDLLLPEAVQRQRFVIETLPAYPNVRLHFDAPIEENVWVQSVRIPTHPTPSGFQHPELLAQVIARLKAHFGTDHGRAPWRRIYASRRNARIRRVSNEEALLPVLERHGFEVLDLEEMSFAEQIRLYAETKVLAGPHGAGLTNMIFMPRGGAVVELRQIAGTPTCFMSLASVTGQGHFYVGCEAEDPNVHFHAADIIADLKKLDRVLCEASCWLDGKMPDMQSGGIAKDEKGPTA